jgi:hypothetical protein
MKSCLKLMAFKMTSIPTIQYCIINRSDMVDVYTSEVGTTFEPIGGFGRDGIEYCLGYCKLM